MILHFLRYDYVVKFIAELDWALSFSYIKDIAFIRMEGYCIYQDGSAATNPAPIYQQPPSQIGEAQHHVYF